MFVGFALLHAAWIVARVAALTAVPGTVLSFALFPRPLRAEERFLVVAIASLLHVLLFSIELGAAGNLAGHTLLAASAGATAIYSVLWFLRARTAPGERSPRVLPAISRSTIVLLLAAATACTLVVVGVVLARRAQERFFTETTLIQLAAVRRGDHVLIVVQNGGVGQRMLRLLVVVGDRRVVRAYNLPRLARRQLTVKAGPQVHVRALLYAKGKLIRRVEAAGA